MLLRFSVTNFACFDEKATLNMVAADDDALRETHVIKGDPAAVRLAALYGANAAGKTRFTDAMATSRRLILKGTRPEQSIPIETFRLHRELRDAPAAFEYVVRIDDDIWTYGFAATRQRIVEEWLYLGPPDAEQTLFERGEIDGKSVISHDPMLAALDDRDQADSRLQFLAEDTRSNQLFLTELRERNHPAAAALIDWFGSGLTVIKAAARHLGLEERSQREQSFAAALGDFLTAAGTGIEAIAVDEGPLEPDRLPQQVREALEDALPEDGAAMVKDANEYLLVHRDDDGALLRTRLASERRDDQGEPVRFEFEEESAGTRQLMNLFPILADGGETPRAYVIDELDRMLHPSLTRAFIDLFVRMAHPRSQLIFTTHESRLMKRDVLRQDEIWVISKTRGGGSRLKPLSDYDIPADMDLDRAYLDGRFGGVPYLGAFERLGRK